MGNVPGLHAYVLQDDGSIAMRNELQVGPKTVEIREVYRYDLDHKVWRTETQGGAYVGSAPPWRSEKWVFEGVEVASGHGRAVRMVYMDLGPVAFRRDFQILVDGMWRTFTAETCKRF